MPPSHLTVSGNSYITPLIANPSLRITLRQACAGRRPAGTRTNILPVLLGASGKLSPQKLPRNCPPKVLVNSLVPSLRHLAARSVSEGKTKLVRNLAPNLRNLAPAGVFETTPIRASFGSLDNAQPNAVGGGFRRLSYQSKRRFSENAKAHQALAVTLGTY